jgi:hypothetical protein
VAAELAVCSTLDHPNIVKYHFHETIASRTSHSLTNKGKAVQPPLPNTSTNTTFPSATTATSTTHATAIAMINLPFQTNKTDQTAQCNLSAGDLVPLPAASTLKTASPDTASDVQLSDDQQLLVAGAADPTQPNSAGTSGTGTNPGTTGTYSCGSAAAPAPAPAAIDHLAGVKTSEVRAGPQAVHAPMCALIHCPACISALVLQR